MDHPTPSCNDRGQVAVCLSVGDIRSTQEGEGVAETLGDSAPDGPRAIPEPLLDAVKAEARTSAVRWFPELDAGSLRVHTLGSEIRARCYLHHVELDVGGTRRRVVVKVRHSESHLRRKDLFEDRPVLTPERTMPDLETARREHEGLLAISEIFGSPHDDRFGVLRPLAWLPEHVAIVMDRVQEPTLRHRLLETSRLSTRRAPRMNASGWRNAGAWLRRFHDRADGDSLPHRNATREEVGEMYRAYAEFLTGRVGRTPMLSRLIDWGRELAEAALPAELTPAPGHGDFVANNMFASETGTITVFDPLIRWRVPRYQDLATLTVGTRVLPVQSLTQGLAIPPADLSRYENAVLAGYFGAEPVPERAVRAFQLLVMLDRWSGTVSKQVQGGGLRPRLHQARVLLAARHYRMQTARLLSLLQ